MSPSGLELNNKVNIYTKKLRFVKLVGVHLLILIKLWKALSLNCITDLSSLKKTKSHHDVFSVVFETKMRIISHYEIAVG